MNNEMAEIKITLPPNKEQQQIADYLTKKCSEIDKIISQKEQIISELESYKKSLIYEYVTGKKRVI
jgi:type I restriction enzyme S subunit